MTKQNRPSLEDYLTGLHDVADIKSQFDFELMSADFDQFLNRCPFMKPCDFGYSQKNQTLDFVFREISYPSDREMMFVSFEYKSKMRQVQDSLKSMSSNANVTITNGINGNLKNV
jgi:V8-like Glu-specific endopeptidase